MWDTKKQQLRLQSHADGLNIAYLIHYTTYTAPLGHLLNFMISICTNIIILQYNLKLRSYQVLIQSVKLVTKAFSNKKLVN